MAIRVGDREVEDFTPAVSINLYSGAIVGGPLHDHVVAAEAPGERYEVEVRDPVAGVSIWITRDPCGRGLDVQAFELRDGRELRGGLLNMSFRDTGPEGSADGCCWQVGVPDGHRQSESERLAAWTQGELAEAFGK